MRRQPANEHGAFMTDGKQAVAVKGRPRALRDTPRQVRVVAHRTGTAAAVIGALRPGDRITGVTAGQFSAIDAMEHLIAELGPEAVVRVSTWTTGLYDAQRAADMRLEGRVKEVRFIVDRGTFEKSPRYAGGLIERLGVDSFRCLSVHAKVIIVSGANGSAAMRTSMNLNKNLRTEQFDIDVGGEVPAFYSEWFDTLWDEAGRSNNNREIIQAVFDRFKAGEDLGADKPAFDEGAFELPWAPGNA